jgi:hypothetical protein
MKNERKWEIDRMIHGIIEFGYLEDRLEYSKWDLELMYGLNYTEATYMRKQLEYVAANGPL